MLNFELLDFFLDYDLWKKYVPQPVEIKTDSVYDYYDILEELGRYVKAPYTYRVIQIKR